MSEKNSGWKPERGWLTAKEIPRNQNGDPEFEALNTVLQVFTPEQVVYLVNKQLYALEYQKVAHRNRAQDERDLLAPLKARFKQMYGGSWAKATEAQVESVVAALKKEKEGQG